MTNCLRPGQVLRLQLGIEGAVSGHCHSSAAPDQRDSCVVRAKRGRTFIGPIPLLPRETEKFGIGNPAAPSR